MVKSNLYKIGFFIALLFFTSCDHSKVFNEYQEINPNGWSFTEALDFEVDIQEQQGHFFNYLIGLRNNNDYLYANIFFFVDIESPNGKHQIDTLQYLLAQPDGKWLGSGVGEIKYNLFKFKELQMMKTGVYKFSISHGMRDDLLLGIEDVGLRIEGAN